MKNRTPKTLVLLSGLAVAAAAFALPSKAEAQTIVVSADFQPMFYDGCVVFYDDWGRPFIYVDGEVQYISTSYPMYYSYVNHWRIHRVRYNTWFRDNGARYRAYRRPGVVHRTPARVHRGPAVTHRAPARSHRGPAVTHRAPAPSHRGPAVNHRAPASSGRGPAMSHRTPSSRGQVGNRTPARWGRSTGRAPGGGRSRGR